MLPGTPRTFIGSTTFAVRGLTGIASQRLLLEQITGVDGVDSVTVDLAGGAVTVRAAGPVDRADIAAAIGRAGFALVP
ncbi:heavy-metal-associated domain-containing protein [Nocardioides pocheonensis]|uniref:heavy-metal-associated domain-containing protein n=1 Tax=Nocardioides pocheonensis TaxID=661485 RepID=UPI0011CE5648|nr:heavy metal-associated domain-containing protein [Nocardioides pocheonensis]